MSDAANIIEVKSKDLKKPVEGLKTERHNRIVIERDVVPIIFVPGIMGSRLKNQKGDTVWDPDSALFMLINYCRIKSAAKHKKSMLIGSDFPPADLDVLKKDTKHNKVFADKNDKTREDRGWGGVLWRSYGKILKTLQNRQWDATVNTFFEFPVHAFGYNWTASNHQAGEKLASEINDTIKKYKDKGRQCEKVILVTHSMGGLVARSACMLHGAKNKVLGIVHGVQPAEGSPAAYWRIKGGFERPHTTPDIDFMQWFRNPVKSFKHQQGRLMEGEGITIPFTDLKANLGTLSAWVLGTDGEEVTALLCNMPGGLELLPNKQYKNNNGWERWLELIDSTGNRTALPKADAYEEIYRAVDVYYRLVNPAWLNPGGTNNSDEFEDIEWNLYAIYLRQAETFHDKLATCDLHPETYQFYSSGIASPDRVIFTSADDTLLETVKRKLGIVKDRTPDHIKSEAKSLVFKRVKGGGISGSTILIDMAGKFLTSAVIKDSDWYQNRGGYREHVDDKGIPSEEGNLQLMTMQLPDGAGDGTVPESSAMALKLQTDKKRTFCIADKREFEKSFVEKHKRLKPKHQPDFDEGYFDRGHEPIYKTQSARFITFTAIENICRKEIKRILGG